MQKVNLLIIIGTGSKIKLLLDKPCAAGREAFESQKGLFLQGKTTFFTNFPKKSSKSGSLNLHILPPNAIKAMFSKNPLFKLCVLSST